VEVGVNGSGDGVEMVVGVGVGLLGFRIFSVQASVITIKITTGIIVLCILGL
jgi:hypothetical protein